jgi:hypothetical protein
MKMSAPPEAQYLDGALEAVREFFARFYTLLDGETPDAAIAWSDSFTKDGEFHFPGQAYTGRAGTSFYQFALFITVSRRLTEFYSNKKSA